MKEKFAGAAGLLFAGLFAVAILMNVAREAVAAGLDVYENVQFTSIQVPTECSTATTSSAVDVSGAKGIGTLVIEASCELNAQAWTNTLTIQESATSNGTYRTLTNQAATACTVSQTSTNTGSRTVLEVDSAIIQGWLRLVTSPDGGTGTTSALFFSY